MTTPDMLIRPARLHDSAELLDWRNDPTTRAMSFDSSVISVTEHQRWFEHSLHHPLRQILMGELAGEKIGMCRFDITAGMANAEVSININPAYRGQGFAAPLLERAVRTFCTDNPAPIIIARTKVSNLASIKTFQKAGFTQDKTTSDVIHWRFCV